MISRIIKRLAALTGQEKSTTQTQAWQRKANAMEMAISFTISNNIAGDYLEFGVFRGKSFIHAYRYYQEMSRRYLGANSSKVPQEFANQRIRFFAFDSFEGLPAVADSNLPAHWKGESAMACDRETFTRNLEQGRVDLNDVVMVPGYYDKSLTPEFRRQAGLERAAIIHVDCDLYESTVTVLDFITPLVVDGTVLVFDDYFYYRGHPARGERGAFSAWLKKNPHWVSTELCKYSPAACYIINVL